MSHKAFMHQSTWLITKNDKELDQAPPLLVKKTLLKYYLLTVIYNSSNVHKKVLQRAWQLWIKDHRRIVPSKEQTIGQKLKEHPDGSLSQHTCVHEIDKFEGGLPKSSMIYRDSWLNQRPRDKKNPTKVCLVSKRLEGHSSNAWLVYHLTKVEQWTPNGLRENRSQSEQDNNLWVWVFM